MGSDSEIVAFCIGMIVIIVSLYFVMKAMNSENHAALEAFYRRAEGVGLTGMDLPSDLCRIEASPIGALHVLESRMETIPSLVSSLVTIGGTYEHRSVWVAHAGACDPDGGPAGQVTIAFLRVRGRSWPHTAVRRVGSTRPPGQRDSALRRVMLTREDPSGWIVRTTDEVQANDLVRRILSAPRSREVTVEALDDWLAVSKSGRADLRVLDHVVRLADAIE